MCKLGTILASMVLIAGMLGGCATKISYNKDMSGFKFKPDD